jgi:dTDP-4-dehydrorhamnose 3,5-epimerase
MKIEGIEIKKLKVFDEGEEGYLFETLRADDYFFEGEFGQNLISFIKPGIIKGLHIHEKQTEYTACIKGNILYVAIKEIPGKEPIIEKYLMGEKNMILLKTPPGIWHGYMVLDDSDAVVLYAMNKTYNPENVDQESKDPNFFGDVWKLDI